MNIIRPFFIGLIVTSSSLAAILAFSQPPTGGAVLQIVRQPSALTVPVDGSFILTVEAAGELPMAFQWYRNGIPLAGATNAELSVYRTQASDDGSYRVILTNLLSSVQSDEARVQVPTVAPTLGLPFDDRIFQTGSPVVLEANATGSLPLSYEWIKDGTTIAQTIVPLLPLPEFGPAAAGAYQVIVRNASGSSTSRVFSVGVDSHDFAPFLMLRQSGGQLDLNFTYDDSPGLLAIYAATNLLELALSGQPVCEQLVNGHGQGSLLLTNWRSNQAQFFKAILHGLATNPAPQTWTFLPVGQFLMGSPPSEAGRDEDEGPQVQMQFSQPVMMSRFEVTQAEFNDVMGFNPSYATGDMSWPVEQVSWDAATNYCYKLTERAKNRGQLPPGYEYRLPTEAEWEYAARAGTTKRFSFGDDLDLQQLGDHAWFEANSGNTPHPVGGKQPNPWGFYDLYGNVAEWCWDYYAPLPDRSGTDPAGPSQGTEHVIRGGSFSDAGDFCRSAFRLYDWTTNAFANVGFRVVLAPIRVARPRNAPSMVWIAPGEYVMGSPLDEQDRQADEGPQTKVVLSQGFFMGRFEVTQAEFQSVMGVNPSYNLGYADQPVDQVTWLEATSFCEQLTALETSAGRLPVGFHYRLPTEAEWEYAARAGTTNRFAHGEDPTYVELGAYAWFMGGKPTHQVGAKRANPWGLYDMAGNVWEWCCDEYSEYPGGFAVEPVISALSDKSMRGGSFFEPGEFCRPACRMSAKLDARYYNVGFRVVLAADPHPQGLDLEMIWVPSGSFIMGSPATELDREPDEGPMHVKISHGFWLGKFEVNQFQYTSLMSTNPSYYTGWSNRPVERVTWAQAGEFCLRLTERSRQQGQLPPGYIYRLPTEAEWEYAARAGTTTRFSYGDDPDYSELEQYSHQLVAPTRGVGSKSPNPWGFYDMHGNVAEWCLDGYTDYSGGTITDPYVPLGTNDWAVTRGGSFADTANYHRSAFRCYQAWNEGDPGTGFRVALAREDITPPFAPVLLARIPAGQFIMGSPVTEAGHEADEWPRTTVILAADFWMSIYEITQAQYRNIMGTNPSWFSTYNNLPVEQVSWDEASEFCHRLTEHEDQAGRLPAGYAYRLPTEAEWEYAARAGSTNQFSYGDDPGYAKISDYAWDKYSSFGTTHAVGTKKPNGWGLYDLSGNVLEWCLDWYGDYPGGQVRNPTGPAEGDFRVMRGGSFYDTGEFCRPAFRLYDWTDDRFYNVGFRVVLAQKVLP